MKRKPDNTARLVLQKMRKFAASLPKGTKYLVICDDDQVLHQISSSWTDRVALAEADRNYMIAWRVAQTMNGAK